MFACPLFIITDVFDKCIYYTCWQKTVKVRQQWSDQLCVTGTGERDMSHHSTPRRTVTISYTRFSRQSRRGNTVTTKALSDTLSILITLHCAFFSCITVVLEKLSTILFIS